MMLTDIAQMVYGYIVKSEIILLRLYKIDPIAMMDHMSLLDLNMYMTSISKEEKKQHESMTKAKIMECLKSVSDYLNLMFYKK